MQQIPADCADFRVLGKDLVGHRGRRHRLSPSRVAVYPPLVCDLNVSAGRPRWNQSFAKLAVLGMTQFDTVVMLDADMMVVDNIDDLFDAPAMSAVAAARVRIPIGST